MIFATGSNFFGQLGLGSRVRESSHQLSPFGSSEDNNIDPNSIADIQCSSQSTLVLNKSGNIAFCGALNGTIYPILTPIDIPLPLKCIQIACGKKHMLALMEKSIVLSWGLGYFGQLGHGDDNSLENPRIINALEPKKLGSKIIMIACGGSHSAALSENNKLFMWGLNRGGQCGVNLKVDSIMEPKPIDTSELGSSAKIQSVVCGRNHSSLLTTGGRVFTWGESGMGRLGLVEVRKYQPYPTEIQLFKTIPAHSIASGDFHMLALGHDGNVYSWGCGTDGQTGQSSLLNVRTPRKIEALEGLQVINIQCGHMWSMAITITGALYVFGYNDGGWLGISRPLSLPIIDNESPAQLIEHPNIHIFDSRHNIIVPQLLELNEWRVQQTRGGSGHMILFCIPMASALVKEKAEEKSKLYNNSNNNNNHKNNISKQVQEDQVMEFDPNELKLESTDGLTPRGSTSKKKSVGELLMLKSNSQVSGEETIPNNNNNSPSKLKVDRETIENCENQMITWSRHKKLSDISYALGIGANANVQDNVGNTPLITACQNGHISVCQLLIRHGADLNKPNFKGNTPLHFCFNYGYENIGALLIENGADEFQTNDDGLTCYEGLCKEDLDYL
eukprot:gene6939-9493_t